MIKTIFVVLTACAFCCKSEPFCQSSDHYCGPNDPFKCIPESWKCDSNIDCENGSDELNCTSLTCSKEQFKCRDSFQCISKNVICDGKSDCFDNSDEYNCTKLRNKCDDKTEYDCKNEEHLECIRLEEVCNKKVNCSTYRNTKENCNIDKCFVKNIKSCSHFCVNKYSSFYCYCPPGMILDQDGKTCKHYNYCLERPNICSQICTDKKDWYSCSCYDGYISKGNQCVSQSEESRIYLFYSSFQNIFGIPIFEMNSTNIINLTDSSENHGNIFAFDIQSNKNGLSIYLTTEKTRKSLKTQESKISPLKHFLSEKLPLHHNIISKVNLANVFSDSMALDMARNLLFFTDRKTSISVMNLTSFDTMQIINEDIWDPISIAIDPLSAKIFWIDLGNETFGPRIEMANMDGSFRRIILENNLQKPISLYFDIDERRLYWANHAPPSIHFIDLNSLDTKITKTFVVLENVELQPYSIAIFGNRIYWSDWHQHRIYSANKINGKGIKMIKEVLKGRTIKIISKEFNDRIINKVHQSNVSISCSGLINTCPYSCLPKFGSSDNPICFGSAPERKTNYVTILWILTPLALLIFGIFGLIKYRRSKTKQKLVNVNNENVIVYDNVQFWDDDRKSNQDENIQDSSTCPILTETA